MYICFPTVYMNSLLTKVVSVKAALSLVCLAECFFRQNVLLPRLL